MFPMVAEADEFREARGMVEGEVARLTAMGHPRPENLKIGFMLETPSLVYAADRLFEEADFISVGGNDLMQFFFAADRENERVRQRYDLLNFSFLRMLRQIVRISRAVDAPGRHRPGQAGAAGGRSCGASGGHGAGGQRRRHLGPGGAAGMGGKPGAAGLNASFNIFIIASAGHPPLRGFD
jgi:phosphotransferase system enzyme I (PtsP)